MEDSNTISTFCKTLASFCNHLQTSSEALKQSMERRPIPLDSASTTFLQHLNRRVSSASNDLNLIESMAFGTVSFEELLGHCTQLYEKNQSDLLQLEDRFKDFGYVPEVEIEREEEEDEVFGLKTPDSKLINREGFDLYSASSCGRSSIMKRLEEDPLLNESLSNLGLSDVCLATLASGADSGIASMRFSQKPANYESVKPLGKESDYSLDTDLGSSGEDDIGSGGGASTAVINISKDDYENLPSFMKSLASWEDLNEAVEKMNSILNSQKNSKESNFFHQDKLTSFGLGPKVRSYLLMLLRMHRLIVETVDGCIVYRVL